MNKILLLIALTILSVPVQAAGLDLKIGMFLVSDHHDETFNYNENHSDSFYACVKSYCAGYYENSYSQTAMSLSKRYSRFVGYQEEIGKLGDIEFSASFGIVDGYTGLSTEDKFVPFVSLNAKYSIFKFWQFGQISLIGVETPRDLFKNWL
jgi:hypothetical protein